MKALARLRGLERRELVRMALPVLALALIASVVTGRERPSQLPPEPVARIDTRIVAAPDADLDLSALERAAGVELAAASANPFARPAFDAPPPAAAAAPEKPAAPPLPFTYLGKVIEDGKLSVFLARGGENLSVSPGDTIGGEYRVDAVTESEIRFTYLPLKTQQSLPL